MVIVISSKAFKINPPDSTEGIKVLIQISYLFVECVIIIKGMVEVMLHLPACQLVHPYILFQ